MLGDAIEEKLNVYVLENPEHPSVRAVDVGLTHRIAVCRLQFLHNKPDESGVSLDSSSVNIKQLVVIL